MMNNRLRSTLYIALFLALLIAVVVSITAAAAQPLTSQTDTIGCWSVYPGHPDKGYQELRGVAALSDSDMWAVGYVSLSDTAQTLITHWDGKAWSTVPSPNASTVRNTLSSVAAVSASDVWAVGSNDTNGQGSLRTLTMHWDGREWSIIPSPNANSDSNELKGIAAVSTDDVWAVGQYTILNGPHSTESILILHWDGTRWAQARTPQPPAMSQLDGIVAISKNDVWAVGSGTGETYQALTMHWDGTAWSIVPAPVLDYPGSLNAVSATGPDDVWAVGHVVTDRALTTPVQTLTMHWNGREWSIVPSPNANLDVRSWSYLNAVVALPGGEAWAFGIYNQNKTPSQPLFMRWNGSAWNLVSSPVRTFTTNLLGAVATTSGSVWTVGSRTSPTQSLQEGLALRHTSAPCASTPTPVATMAPPLPIPGTGSITFPDTGETLSGIFLDYWQAHGGLPQQGYPTSNVMGEVSDLNGKTYTMQYFERAVFEYHPENKPPYNVLLSQLGTFEYRKRYGTQGALGQRPNTTSGSILVPETGKRLGGKFLQYWRENGGLMQQGHPISDEFTEISALNGKPYLVQYFERAVFEYHPENQPPYDVLLAHLGRFRYNQQYNSAANATPLAGNIGNTVAGGKYLLWEDRGLPNNPIYSHDVERSTRALVTEKPGYKFDMATDGTHAGWVIPLNSFTQTSSLDSLHLDTGARFSVPFTNTGVGGLALEDGVFYYHRGISDGVAIVARDILTGSERILVYRQFRVEPNGTRSADVLFQDIRVKDGVLLWSESRYKPDSPPTNSESSLHMLKLDGTMSDTVLATALGNLRGFDLSGDNVVWAFSPLNLADPPDASNRVTLYNIRTGVKKLISPEGIRASDPIIRGNLVVWAEGTSALSFQEPSRPYNTTMKLYDIESGATYALFRQSTFITPLAISGKMLAFTQQDRINDTTGLYLIELPASGEAIK